MTDEQDIGPLFGGAMLRASSRRRRVGAPAVAADPVWAGSSEQEREDARVVLEALNEARRTYGMPCLKQARMSPTSAIPVIIRLRELSVSLQGSREDPVAALIGCVSARVALHATSSIEAVRRGDYSNTRSILGDDDKWEPVLNAGRAWALGDRSAPKPKASTSETTPARTGVRSHAPRR